MWFQYEQVKNLHSNWNKQMSKDQQISLCEVKLRTFGKTRIMLLFGLGPACSQQHSCSMNSDTTVLLGAEEMPVSLTDQQMDPSHTDPLKGGLPSKRASVPFSLVQRLSFSAYASAEAAHLSSGGLGQHLQRMPLRPTTTDRLLPWPGLVKMMFPRPC